MYYRSIKTMFMTSSNNTKHIIFCRINYNLSYKQHSILGQNLYLVLVEFSFICSLPVLIISLLPSNKQNFGWLNEDVERHLFTDLEKNPYKDRDLKVME